MIFLFGNQDGNAQICIFFYTDSMINKILLILIAVTFALTGCKKSKEEDTPLPQPVTPAVKTGNYYLSQTRYYGTWNDSITSDTTYYYDVTVEPADSIDDFFFQKWLLTDGQLTTLTNLHHFNNADSLTCYTLAEWEDLATDEYDFNWASNNEFSLKIKISIFILPGDTLSSFSIETYKNLIPYKILIAPNEI